MNPVDKLSELDPTKKAASLLEEFKNFAFKGNVVDLAIGVIIGGAFGKIVSSFVNDVLMPPIGMALGNVDFSQLMYILKPAEGEVEAVAIKYGAIIQTALDFIIIAFAIFMVIKAMNKMKKKEGPKEEPKEDKKAEEPKDNKTADDKNVSHGGQWICGRPAEHLRQGCGLRGDGSCGLQGQNKQPKPQTDQNACRDLRQRGCSRRP